MVLWTQVKSSIPLSLCSLSVILTRLPRIAGTNREQAPNSCSPGSPARYRSDLITTNKVSSKESRTT
jgi:hypothetical protein